MEHRLITTALQIPLKNLRTVKATQGTRQADYFLLYSKVKHTWFTLYDYKIKKMSEKLLIVNYTMTGTSQ